MARGKNKRRVLKGGNSQTQEPKELEELIREVIPDKRKKKMIEILAKRVETKADFRIFLALMNYLHGKPGSKSVEDETPRRINLYK